MPGEAGQAKIEPSDLHRLTASTADTLDALRSLIIGHRQALLDDGFSWAAAEEMAVDLHRSVAEEWFVR